MGDRAVLQGGCFLIYLYSSLNNIRKHTSCPYLLLTHGRSLIYPVTISCFTVVKAKGKLFHVMEVSSSFTLIKCDVRNTLPL